MDFPPDYRLVEIEKSPLEGPYEWAYRGAARVVNTSDLADLGHSDMDSSPEQFAAQWVSTQGIKRMAVIVHGTVDAEEAVVGYAGLSMRRDEGSTQGWSSITVLPEHRRLGLGSAMLAWVEDAMRQENRTVLNSYIMFSEQVAEATPEDQRLVPTSGIGWVPANDPSIVWAIKHGFTVGQQERPSILALPVPADKLERLFQQARDKSGDYRTHVWFDTIPEPWMEQYAQLKARMSTDVPQGGLEVEETKPSVEKLVDQIQATLAMGRHCLVTVAEHIATGELAAINELSYEPDKKQVFQEDTIVDPPHRGHRLGMLVKATNIVELQERHPTAERIWTWNAEENDHMLAINIDLGFQPSGGEASIQKHL
jgi:GNAT superfamily N-acetyltransferase